MKITLVEIRNILGLESLDLKPGAVNIISGRNGAGKTSLLEALRAAFRGGHDPSLLRKGAVSGTIHATTDDGTDIIRSVTAARSSLDVRIPVVGKASRPQNVVDALVDEFGVDPLSIIQCPPSKRASLLADVMPLELEPQAIEKATSRKGLDDGQGHALDRIDRARKTLYDERTGINRSLKDKKAAASQLRETLPASDEKAEPVAFLRAKLDDLQQEGRAEGKEILDRKNTVIAQAKAKADRLIEEARAELQKATEAAGRQQQIEGAALEAEYVPKMAELGKALGAATERERVRAQAEKTGQMADRLEKESGDLADQADALTDGLGRLDDLRLRLLEKLPIPGLEIRGGDVFVDDIAFDRVNTARQIEVAVRVAALRAGKLGLVVVDRAECLDAEHFAMFKEAAKAANLQLFVARVSEGSLAVETQP